MPASGVLLCAQILDEHVSCHLFGTFELIHESLTWKVYSAFVFFFFFFLLVSSSPCMFIHIKLYQQRAYTSLSNKHQGKSRYNWLAQRLPASGASCITEKRPAGWIMIEWHHGLARVLRSRCSLEIFCPLWGMWVVLLPGIQWRNRTLLLCAASTLD